MSKSTKKVAGDRHIAGENNGRFFKFKVAEKFYQINTNNFHNYDHAWKWRRGSVSAPPWRYFCWFWLKSRLIFVRDITGFSKMDAWSIFFSLENWSRDRGPLAATETGAGLAAAAFLYVVKILNGRATYGEFAHTLVLPATRSNYLQYSRIGHPPPSLWRTITHTIRGIWKF